MKSSYVKWLFLVVGLMFLFGVSQAALFSATQAGSTSGPLEEPKFYQSYRLQYLNAKEFAENMSALFGGNISPLPSNNSIVAKAPKADLKRLEQMIEKLDIAPKQVYIEAKVIEIKGGNGDSTNPSKLGLDIKYTKNTDNYAQTFNFADRLTGTASLDAGQVGMFAHLLSGNVDAYLSALEKKITYNMVASPKLSAINHKEAKILIGAKYGYKTSIISQTSTVQEVHFLEVGSKLTFTPHITDGGFILMDIQPSISDGSVVGDLPQENTTETNNRVLVKDGQTIVIGGLTKDGVNQIEWGVPILKDIPFIGNLFRKTTLVTEKRELMVFMTPHIVTPEFLTMMADKAKNFEALQQEKSSGVNLIH